MIISAITSQASTYKVELALTGAPSVTAGSTLGGEETYEVTGVRITYADTTVTAIRYFTTDGDLFVDPEYLGQPELWPSWLAQLADQHRPAAVASA